MPKKKSDESQVVLYHTPDGKVTVDVIFARENFWLTQRTMAELFGVNMPAINKHLKKIFAVGELRRRQLFPFWKQLPLRAVKTSRESSFTIWTR